MEFVVICYNISRTLAQSQTFQIQILAPLPRSYVTSLVNYNTLDDYLSMDVFSALKLSLKVRLPGLSSLSFPLTFSFCEIIVFQVPLKEILALFLPHAFLISCIQLYIRPYYVSLHSEFFLLLLFKKKNKPIVLFSPLLPLPQYSLSYCLTWIIVASACNLNLFNSTLQTAMSAFLSKYHSHHATALFKTNQPTNQTTKQPKNIFFSWFLRHQTVLVFLFLLQLLFLPNLLFLLTS